MAEILGSFVAFRNEGEGDEYTPQKSVPIELTGREDCGEVEIAFNAPLPGKPRLYLKFKLHELVALAVRKQI